MMWSSDKFTLGLVSFLTGHVFYILGLISGIELSLSWYVWLPLIILGSGMFLGLRFGLGKNGGTGTSLPYGNSGYERSGMGT
jgi:uncharacterized membrane protein YhhN